MSTNKIGYISLARVLAMLMILGTHFMAFMGDDFLRHFLCGIPLFLMISGFVYANKVIIMNDFAFKRFCRIMIPAYLYMIIVFVCSAIFYNSPTPKDILTHIFNLQGIWNVVPRIKYFGFPRLGILWFLTSIGLCYVFLPILKSAEKKFSIKLRGHSLILVVMALVQIALAYLGVQLYYLLVFYLGYFLGKYLNRVKTYQFILSGIIVIAFNVARLIARRLIGDSILYEYTIVPYAEALTALAVIGVLYLLWKNFPRIIDGIADCKLVKTFDKYSMSVYIIHYTFYTGILPATRFTSSKILALVLMIVLTIIAVYPFQKLCELTEKGICKLRNRN